MHLSGRGLKLPAPVNPRQKDRLVEWNRVGGQSLRRTPRNRPSQNLAALRTVGHTAWAGNSRRFIAAMNYVRTVILRLTLTLALSSLIPITARGQSNPRDLTGVSLEDLMNVQVTSVSKKEQKLSKTGTAIYVITQEDIRRSGMTNIPDLLRMVPGMDVARLDANAWAISIRGFNFRYSTKVLVLIDGRTVYTPQFSGVYWDQQDVPLEDIERIEVIRGPGGTVWGANAVNGVINIITKRSEDTQGGLITSGTGSKDSAQGLVQYGGRAGGSGSYRVFGRYFKEESSTEAAGGGSPFDGWHGAHAGFRSDWNLSNRDQLTVQGDLFGTSEGQTSTNVIANNLLGVQTSNNPIAVGSGNILGRWNHTFSNGSETSLQVYYDHVRRLDQGLADQDTGDADLNYHFHIGSRNDIVTGAGYRLTSQTYMGGYGIVFGSGYRNDNLFNTFRS